MQFRKMKFTKMINSNYLQTLQKPEEVKVEKHESTTVV